MAPFSLDIDGVTKDKGFRDEGERAGNGEARARWN
jgi:hypothetical protein